MRIAIVVGIVVALAGVARADNAAEATKLFDEGRALLGEKKYAEACAKFAKSSELDRKPGTQLNLGECAERDGQLRRAWLLFDDAAREYGRIRLAADGRLAKEPNSADALRDSQVAAAGARFARERADALAPRLAKVVVRLAEPRVDGLALRIGDRAVPPAAEIVELLDSGNVTISANAPGREPFTTMARAEAGKEVVVDIPAMRAIGSGAPGLSPGDIATENKRKPSRVKLALGLGAGGIVLLAVSGVVGVSANSQYKNAEKECDQSTGELVCPPDPAKDIESAGTKADIATFAGVAGLALAAGAVVIYFTAPRERISITPMASPSSAGVSLSGRF